MFRHPFSVVRAVATILVLAALVTSGCSGSDSGDDASTSTSTSPEGSPRIIEVPKDAPTITDGVRAARKGDLVLVAPGTYEESVTIETDGITLRGEDRNTVILVGGGTMENGVTVFADGVTVENLTIHGYRSNGVLFTGDYGKGHTLTGFRTSYVTAYANGLYGIYAFNAMSGLIDHTYTSAHPDAGVYVGQCFPCDTVVSDNVAEHNAVGFQATNAGGDLFVIGNTWRSNRVGVEPTSSAKERQAPQRGAVIAGNAIVDNADPQTPMATEAFGYGITIGGGHNNRVLANRITGNPAAGVIMSPQEQFLAEANEISGNVLEANGVDLVYASVDGARLGNCFARNTFNSSSPADIEKVLGCAPEAQGGRGAPAIVAAPPSVDPADIAVPAPQPTRPGDPRVLPTALGPPPKIDLETITVPPAGVFPGST